MSLPVRLTMVDIPVVRDHFSLDDRPLNNLGRGRLRRKSRAWGTLLFPLYDPDSIPHLRRGRPRAWLNDTDPLGRATAGFPHDPLKPHILLHPPPGGADASGSLDYALGDTDRTG